MDIETGLEFEGGISVPGPIGVEAGELTKNLTFSEKITFALLSTFGTILVTFIGLALRSKRKEGFAEDTVYSVSIATIERLTAELESKNAEIRTVAGSRDEYQRASIVMEANLAIAQQAVKLAEQAARYNLDELRRLREHSERCDRYIYILRGVLAQNNLPIPPEPTE